MEKASVRGGVEVAIKSKLHVIHTCMTLSKVQHTYRTYPEINNPPDWGQRRKDCSCKSTQKNLLSCEHLNYSKQCTYCFESSVWCQVTISSSAEKGSTTDCFPFLFSAFGCCSAKQHKACKGFCEATDNPVVLLSLSFDRKTLYNQVLLRKISTVDPGRSMSPPHNWFGESVWIYFKHL